MGLALDPSTQDQAESSKNRSKNDLHRKVPNVDPNILKSLLTLGLYWDNGK